MLVYMQFMYMCIKLNADRKSYLVADFEDKLIRMIGTRLAVPVFFQKVFK